MPNRQLCSKIKSYSIIFLFIVIFILLWQGCKLQHNFDLIKPVTTVIRDTFPNPPLTIIDTFWKDREGVFHYANKEDLKTGGEAKQTSVADLKPLFDSLKNQLLTPAKEPEKQVVLASIPIVIRFDSGAYYHHQIDSLANALRRANKKLNNQFLTVKETTDTAGGEPVFSYDAKLKARPYSERIWYFFKIIPGPKMVKVEITADDPRATINGQKKYIVDAGQPNDGFRLTTNFNYLPNSNSFRAGVGAMADFGRFSLQGNYMMDLKTQKWSPTFSLRANVLRMNFKKQ